MQHIKKMNTLISETVLYGALVIPTDENRSWVVPTNLTTWREIRGAEKSRDSFLFELENADEAARLFDTVPPTYASGVFVPRYALWYRDEKIGTFWVEMFELLAGEPLQTQGLEEKLSGLNRQFGETLAAFAAWNLFRGTMNLDRKFLESCRRTDKPKESYSQLREKLEGMADSLTVVAGKTMSQNSRLIENGRQPSNYSSGILIRDLRQVPGFGSDHYRMEVIWGADLGFSPAKISYRQSIPSFVDLYAPAEEYHASRHQIEVITRVKPLMDTVRTMTPVHYFETDAKPATDSL